MFWQNDTKCRWEFSHELLDNKGHIRHITPDLKGFSPNQFPQLSALKKKVTPNSHLTCNWEQRINNHLPNVPLLRSYFIYLWFVWTSFFSFFSFLDATYEYQVISNINIHVPVPGPPDKETLKNCTALHGSPSFATTITFPSAENDHWF